MSDRIFSDADGNLYMRVTGAGYAIPVSSVVDGVAVPDVRNDIATALADPGSAVGQKAAEVAAGSTYLALYDDFSRYADGPLAGKAPSIGNAWVTTGGSVTTVDDGRVIGATPGANYAVQTFDDRPTIAFAIVGFEGADPAKQTMTISWCRDPNGSNLLNHLVHLNFSPTGFNLTVRQDGAAAPFPSVLQNVWRKVVPFGELRRFGLSVVGDNAIVYGPYGEVFAVTDRRIGKALEGGGHTVFWEPVNDTTGTTDYGYLYGCSAFVTADSRMQAATLQHFDVAGVGNIIGQAGRVVGSRNQAGEAWIGRDPTTNMPAMGFGASEIHAILLADTAIGATSFQTDQKIPAGSTLLIGYGNGAETLTQNTSVASGGAAPFTSTTTAAATKAHAAGDPVTATPPSSQRVTIALNTQNGQVTLPDALMMIPNVAGLYFGSALDTRLYRFGADTLAVGSGDTFLIPGGAWNTGLLRIGQVYVWDDGTGLRIKRGSAPTSATDGTVLY